MWMLRALWLVVAHDLSEYRYIDDVTRSLVCLFCSTWRAVLKMFVRLLRIKASWILRKKFNRSYLQETKMEKRGQKELLTTLECLNYKKSLPSCFIASKDSPFSKMFSPLFCFAQEKALKNFSKKLYTIKIKKKEEEETKSSAWNLKNA